MPPRFLRREKPAKCAGPSRLFSTAAHWTAGVVIGPLQKTAMPGPKDCVMRGQGVTTEGRKPRGGRGYALIRGRDDAAVLGVTALD